MAPLLRLLSLWPRCQVRTHTHHEVVVPPWQAWADAVAAGACHLLSRAAGSCLLQIQLLLGVAFVTRVPRPRADSPQQSLAVTLRGSCTDTHHSLHCGKRTADRSFHSAANHTIVVPAGVTDVGIRAFTCLRSSYTSHGR